MSANKNVIVLVPNGGRQNIAVTPNTTILQVLEEICQKHGYNIDDYDLKHFNHVLDPNAILRFTGLGNNAQLEMISRKKIRSVSTVTIGIQLENGQRLMGEFIPNTTLVEVLQKLKYCEDFEEVTLTYIHCEISGVEALRTTTLKSLGLNNGKAILRLLRKNSENTSVSKILKKNGGTKKNSSTNSNKASDFVSIFEKESEKSKKMEARTQSTGTETKVVIKMEEIDKMVASSSKYDNNRSQILLQHCSNHEINDLNTINFIGERNALIFNQAAIQGAFKEDLPDDFYDLTVYDAKILLRDAKRYRKELEEAPLLTNVQRQLNQEKETLNQLNKYHCTIIRIHFPDQFVLQGLFQPTETIQAIRDFIKGYLTDANSDFVVFTTPPKRILNPSARLINENLVPCAIVYYSGQSALKSNVKEKVTDPKKVEMQVTKVRSQSQNFEK